MFALFCAPPGNGDFILHSPAGHPPPPTALKRAVGTGLWMGLWGWDEAAQPKLRVLV